MVDALSVAAEGGKAGIAKPMKGLGEELWVVHTFQKKSMHGVKTPKHEIDLMSDRLKRLKEILR